MTNGMSLSFYLPDSADQARRNSIVADHFPGTGSEQEFTGFTPADEAGFGTPITALDWTAVLNLMDGATKDQTMIIECDWDGISTSSKRVSGVQNSVLTPNSSVDFGYNRPGQKILVRPKNGRSPIAQGTFSSGGLTYSDFTGMNYVEFRNMTFTGGHMNFSKTATYPIPAIIAFIGCTFSSVQSTAGSISCPKGVRALHIEGCSFNDCRSAMIGSGNWIRFWRNVVLNHRDADIIGVRGFSTYETSWRSRIWSAGNLVYSPSQTGNLNSGQHLDYAQVSSSQSSVAEHDIFHEFNILYLNRPSTENTQALFGSDGTVGKYDWFVHNNLICVSNNWAIRTFDPSNDGKKSVVRNTCSRIGNGPGPNASGTRIDNAPKVEGFVINTGTGLGELLIKHNIYCTASSSTSSAAGQQNTNNQNVDPRKPAITDRMDQIFTGNGTWTNSNLGNFWEYSIGDQGQTPSTARTLIRNFFMPILAGQTTYAAVASHVGCTDPNNWPTNFAAPLGSEPDQMAAPQLASTATRVIVTFAADPADFGSPITSHDLRYSVDGGATWTVVGGASSGHIISGMAPGTVGLLVQTRAINAIGPGAWSSSATVDMKVVTFVGYIYGFGQTANYTMDITNWSTGSTGVGGPILPGDIILLSSGWATANADQDPGANGFTEILDVVSFDTRTTNHSVAWKLMGPVPDTSIVVNGPNNTANGSCAIAAVFRYVDPGSPFDIGPASTTGINSALANPPPITPLSPGAVVVVATAETGDTTPAFQSPPAGMSLAGQRTNGGSGTQRGFRTLIAYQNWTSGSFDPGPIGTSESSTSDSWSAATLALRPW